MNCVICYQELTNGFEITRCCNHSLCFDCINNCRYNSSKCPYCRYEPSESKQIYKKQKTEEYPNTPDFSIESNFVYVRNVVSGLTFSFPLSQIIGYI